MVDHLISLMLFILFVRHHLYAWLTCDINDIESASSKNIASAHVSFNMVKQIFTTFYV